MTPDALIVIGAMSLLTLVLVGLALALQAVERRWPALTRFLDERMPEKPWWSE